MKIRFRYYDKLPPFLRNKYVIAIIIFVIWVLFLDSNNLIYRFRQMRELRKMKKDKEYYEEKIRHDREVIEKLRDDPDYLEKYAREKYLMKKKDEDLFIVVPPNGGKEGNK
ncbi:MAG TPA: hypothetical protein P5257_10195 [Bacteroidales bacterium]|nr:hypothetical protein [Bacteroidales bacterium]HRR93374.1 hypothetical protein [Bacteroidales bacterium]HRT90476.1 hypothetical protein [Bacteroidales bacterium]